MNSALRLGVRHTLHAMNAAFVFEFCKNSVAGNVERAFFQSAKLGFVNIDILDVPTLFFGVHFVHTHYFHCEKRGFLSAGSAAYFDYYVFVVVGVFGKQQNFKLFFGFLQFLLVFFCFELGKFD